MAHSHTNFLFSLYENREKGAPLRDATVLCCLVLRAKTAPNVPDPSGGGFFQIYYANFVGRVSLRICFTSTKEGIA
jgi:hypothetical protein